MAQVKKTKEHYHVSTKHVFDFMNKCSKSGIKIDNNKTYHVECNFPADLSCHWKVLKMGGACKVAHFFCHLCGCTSDRCAKFRSGSKRCQRCKRSHTAKCHHFKIDDDDKIDSKKARKLKLELKYPYLKDLKVDANDPFFQFLSDPNDANRKNMPNHIDYEGETRADKLAFSAQVTQQLQLRNINTEGRLNVQVQTLRKVLFDQDECFTISKTIDRYEKAREERVIHIMWCVPCIMHLHNRVVEKIIVMLLKKGYSKRGSREEKELYICTIEHTMNSCVLGSQYNEVHWKVPLNEAKTDITGTISLTNMQSKKVITFIHLLLADVFDDTVPDWESQLEEWTSVIELFSKLNKLICARMEFTDDMIEEFQSVADAFFLKWVSINGLAGVTNYIHMLGSGHLMEFLYKYRNLYKYSQQGWEHLNKYASGVYHKHSQKGGHRSSLESRSQILPIFRFFTRAWMWATKKADEIFNTVNE